MRPYLAIIRDSFHEALASRVLWILVVLSTLFLVALAPLGITERADSLLTRGDFADVPALAKKLRTQGQRDRPSPGRRIFELASDDLKAKLSQPLPKGSDHPGTWARSNQLVTELNAMLERADFYNPADWAGVALGKEARDLLDKNTGEPGLNTRLDKLPPDRLARFNRLVLDAAFPEQIVPSGPPQVQFSYLVWDVGSPLPLERKDLVAAVSRTLLLFMGLVLGVAGILAAILVTASMIPQTFEAGAIDLLLSKPVARSLVFLTKFVGGCAFISLIVMWLIGGLWLILGLRLAIWNPRLLLCIPLYLFLFAIYYAVSALAGVVWKNAIVSVVLTVLFWFVCWSMGTAKNVLETLVLNPQRLVKIISAGDTLLAVNESGKVLRWEEADGTWSEVFASAGSGGPQFAFGLMGALIGPVYDPHGQRLLAIDKPPEQFGRLGRDRVLLIGKPGQDWRRISGPAVPAGVEALLVDSQGTPLVVTQQAVFRLKGNAEAKPQPTKIWGFELPFGGEGPKFVEASPALQMSTPLSAAEDPATSELAIFDGRRLVLLARATEGTYRVRVETDLADYAPGIVAYSGATLVLALADGRVQVYDPADLRLKRSFTLEKPNAPRFIAAGPGGRWVAVVFHGGRLWLYDAQQEAERSLATAGLRDVSAATFAAPNQLLVADDGNRVTEYDLAAGRIEKQRQPALSTWEAAYRYAVKPLYMVFPKPGELDNMVHYLLTDETSVPLGSKKNDLSGTRVKIDVWGPVWSNLAFLGVVLAIACVYVSRKDF